MKLKVFFWSGMLCCLSGCTSILESKAQQFGVSFSQAVLENNDPILVEQALPSYLLLLDAMLKNQPQNASLLHVAAKLNSAYAGAFVSDAMRSRKLNDKAFSYAAAALCLEDKNICDLQKIPIAEMELRLAKVSKEKIASLYVLGSAWAGWIQVHSDDWNAIADLARVKMIMQRVLTLDEGYQRGEVHLYLGVLASLLSPALGGQPEVGKTHFEKALLLSEGKNLMAKVYYAKFYARNTFNRELHDVLLQEVIASNPQNGDLTLSNLLAQQQAKTLLESADDYF